MKNLSLHSHRTLHIDNDDDNVTQIYIASHTHANTYAYEYESHIISTVLAVANGANMIMTTDHHHKYIQVNE